MRRRLTVGFALVALLALAGQATAEIGTVDAVPAATLLLPYFEVDLGNVNGINTLFSINNASATATIAHVTLWTDMSIPTLDFDVYLTGYDIQTISIRDIFNGNLPVTASDGQDPKDTISPQGDCSQDINFASCTGFLPYSNPVLGATLLTHIRRAHTGLSSTVFPTNRCSAFPYGDNIARGYITVDTVTQCSLLFPSSPGYFTGVADFRNILWGDYFFVNSGQNFAQGETLVHIESCEPREDSQFNGFGFYQGYVGNGAGNCPFAPGEYTFYGRYVAGVGIDQREPLATQFFTRYINGGIFTGGTDLIVWRDSKTTPSGANGPFVCGGSVAWFPLSQADVVGFDEQEQCENLCFQGDNVSPPIGGADTCFPLEAQRVAVGGGNVAGDDFVPSSPFGSLFLNLNTSTAAVGGIYNRVAQAWVVTIMDADGRFSVGFDAIPLDNALYTCGIAANCVTPVGTGPGLVIIPN
jgi:hypothetical protein